MYGIKQLMKLIKQYKWQVLLAALLGSCTVLCSVGLLGASAVLISKAAIVPAMLELMTLVALVRFFGLFRAVFRYLERLVSHDVTLNVLADLRSWFYRKLMPLLPGAVGNRGNSLLKMIINDIEVLQFFYLRVVAAPLICVIVMAVMTGVLYQLVPQAAQILLITFLLEGVVFSFLFGFCYKAYAHAGQLGEDSFYLHAGDFLQGYDAVWFGGNNSVNKAKSERKEGYQYMRISRHVDNLLSLCTGLVSAFVLLGSFYVSAAAVNAGTLDGVYLVMVPLMAWSALEAVHPMPLAMRYLFESREAMDDMLRVLQLPVRGREEKNCPTPNWQNTGLAFDRVGLAHGGKSVLYNISFAVEPGEHMAIVGSIGSGKSSIFHLLLGFYQQDEGTITIDGVNIETVNVEQLGAHIAVVQQECAFFSGTIRENLLNVADSTEEQMWDALRKAELYDYVQQLPHQLDYVLAESGSNLSGGQKKRLALAQLFLQDKPIVLLDEVLEGLDPKNSQTLLQTILDYCKDRTLLYITHDTTVLEHFDSVLEL